MMAEPTREADGSRGAMFPSIRPGPFGLAIAAGIVSGCGPVETSSTQRFSASGELVSLSGAGAGAVNACFTCHGLDGRGDGAGSPRLAALDSGYMLRQLESYADGRRQHPQMSWIARQLSAEERRGVADFYAGMPFDAEPKPALDAPALYLRGDRSRGLPACAGCHGLAGQGIGPANPPLAGQPAAYLAGQIEQWRHARRRNDPRDAMLRISQILTPREAVDLAVYAATLAGGPPSPEFPEAFREGHRAGPRNDVSGPRLHVPESARATE